MEHFYTIQGEGAFTGHASYFIRLGGCDVGCHWCDVKESWPIDAHPKYEIDSLTQLVTAEKGKIAVITGGEPLMHNCMPLTNALQNAGIRTHIETSGAFEPTGNWDWFCLSPKKFKLPVKSAYELADELKMIIFNKSDFEFAEEQLAKLIEYSPDNQLNTKLFLQPEWSKREEMMPAIVSYVKAHSRWKISLQTHKYLNIP
ncbi:MAG: 7-carboxy-7-deazaguanine synthase QueE [Cytophagales bacterium]